MSSARERLATAPQTGEDRERIFDAFRRWGYLAANLDPLGFLQPFVHPEIAASSEISDQARRIYCGATGAEFMHSADAERCRWVAERIESDAAGADRSGGPAAKHSWVLGRLIRTELFEQVLRARYVGTKRYSLEGLASLIPLLDGILEAGAASGAEQVVLAMSHRGRLNVMVHIVCRPPEEIFAEFEDVDPRSVLGSGDVKYHVGATGRYRTAAGRTVEVHLVSNPSHLEAVDPVAMGRTRAKQARIGPDGSRRVLPIVVHGDAAFAGQGIWAETLNLAGLAGYGVSGTIHIIANNLLGFTTPPAEHLAPGQARCEIHNSPLSEAGILGFEYGYSRDYPEALVLWEAQFGDFANGAQVIIDQFISAAEDKWDLPSGVALLLPHGYEGQGPEHSSARIERFLQLAAEDNIQICQPSSAAQYFHLLRRQALRRWRKPLIAFMPKGMLRNPAAASRLADFTNQGQPRFLNVVPEREVTTAKRILICSGKIAHELRSEHSRRGSADAAIVVLDQLYPFPADELETELARHPEAREIVWVQEEPANMGALFYVVPQIAPVGGGRPVRSVKRSASASPATGSAKAHELEQKTLLTLALTTGDD